jgi:signal transduction histidine kinase
VEIFLIQIFSFLSILISLQLLIFIKGRKVRLLLFNLLPLVLINVSFLLIVHNAVSPAMQYIIYAVLLIYPFLFSYLALDFTQLHASDYISKFLIIAAPYSILYLLYSEYIYTIIFLIHLSLYAYLFIIIKNNFRLKFHILTFRIFPSLFLIYFYIYFDEPEIFILILDLMYIITLLNVLYEYSKRVSFLSTRLVTINSMNKRLNQIITRLRQRNDTLKKIISQKDVELLQIARHASLAEVTTGIAHELAQPLTGIKCISQNMIDDINFNDFDHIQGVSDLAKISSLVDRSASIIDHIRTFSCKRGFSFQQADLNACVLNAIELINNQMKNSSIDLIFVLDDSIPKIYGDNLSLEQLFINFLLNSRDAIVTKKQSSPDFSGVIKITTAFNDEIVRLIIEDNGSGIPADIIPKIWTPFFTTKQKGKGTGIGLSLSHRIIKEHNADVSISSSGEGTVFTITFPVKNPQQDNES